MQRPFRATRWVITAAFEQAGGRWSQFCDGAQHKRPTKERFRPSSFDTLVAVLQSAAAAKKHPCDEASQAALRAAMVRLPLNSKESLDQYETPLD